MYRGSQTLAVPDNGRVKQPSVTICVLGNFRLLRDQEMVHVQAGSKTEYLLCRLVLRHGRRVPRDLLIESLWPQSDPASASASLNSLVYAVHRLISDERAATPLILHADGYYGLNAEAGVRVDAWTFDELVEEGDKLRRAGSEALAAGRYEQAVELYRGDLCAGPDVSAVVERERLRSTFLGTLARLADFHFQAEDYGACLEDARRLLSGDPCREDAHRMMMRCYVRLGQRAEALRQFRVCEQVLSAEFGAAPERATTALAEQVRLDPDSV